MLTDCRNMARRAIAFVRGKSVTGIPGIQLSHEGIPVLLGMNPGKGNGQ